MKVNYRYFLRLEEEPEREVSKDTYERMTGLLVSRSVWTPDGIVHGRVKAEVEN